MAVKRNHLVLLTDSGLAASSFVLALFMRQPDMFNPDIAAKGAAAMAVIWLAVSIFFNVHRNLWRYVSIQEITGLLRAACLTMLLFLPAMFMLNRLDNIPRSSFPITLLLLAGFLTGSRFFYRWWHERFSGEKDSDEAKSIPILVLGINSHTDLFLRQSQKAYTVIGLLDNSRSKQGQKIRGVKVLGTLKDVSKVLKKLKAKNVIPQKVIFAPGTIEGPELRNVVNEAVDAGLSVGRLPRLTEFRSGLEEKIDIRPIVVEDLLGRPQTALDKPSMQALIRNKKILITGAGGTIGSELVRQIVQCAPAEITLFEHSEHNLYLIDKELEDRQLSLVIHPVIGDVRDRTQVEDVFVAKKPDIVFHAAALKHVPMVEKNIAEGVLTNMMGTQNIADACVKAGVKAMIMISTDKAVHPLSVMGATKRAAERYIQGLSEETHTTQFLAVRFGNVLGSAGSVVPLFKNQLEAGGPITVTHPDMVRYFMTVREAVELVLQASVLGAKADKNGHIYVLDMGEPVYIKDLAAQMIRLAGLKPDEDIKIVYTGLRPGEKMYEELFYEAEKPRQTEYQGIMLASPEQADKEIKKHFSTIARFAEQRDISAVLQQLKRIVPEMQREIELEPQNEQNDMALSA